MGWQLHMIGYNGSDEMKQAILEMINTHEKVAVECQVGLAEYATGPTSLRTHHFRDEHPRIFEGVTYKGDVGGEELERVQHKAIDPPYKRGMLQGRTHTVHCGSCGGCGATMAFFDQYIRTNKLWPEVSVDLYDRSIAKRLKSLQPS